MEETQEIQKCKECGTNISEDDYVFMGYCEECYNKKYVKEENHVEEKEEDNVKRIRGIAIKIIIVVLLVALVIMFKMPNKYFGEWTCKSNDEYTYVSTYSNYKLVLYDDHTFSLNGNALMYVLGNSRSMSDKYKGTYTYFAGNIFFKVTETNDKTSFAEKITGVFNNDKLTLKVTSKDNEIVYYEFKK